MEHDDERIIKPGAKSYKRLQRLFIASKVYLTGYFLISPPTRAQNIFLEFIRSVPMND